MKSIQAKGEYDFDTDIFHARPIERIYDSSFAGDFIFDVGKNRTLVLKYSTPQKFSMYQKDS